MIQTLDDHITYLGAGGSNNTPPSTNDDAELWKPNHLYKTDENFTVDVLQDGLVDKNGTELEKGKRYLAYYPATTNSGATPNFAEMIMISGGSSSKDKFGIIAKGDTLANAPLASENKGALYLLVKDDNANHRGLYKSDGTNWVWFERYNLFAEVDDIEGLENLKNPMNLDVAFIKGDLPIISFYVFSTSATIGVKPKDGTTGFWNRVGEDESLVEDITKPDNTITSTTEYSSFYSIKKVIDNNTNSRWYSKGNPTYPILIDITPDKEYNIQALTLKSPATTYSPKDFDLIGTKADGTQETILKKRGVTIIGNADKKTFMIGQAYQNTKYEKFQLKIIANNGGHYCALKELELAKVYVPERETQYYKAPVKTITELKALENNINGEARQVLEFKDKVVIFRFIENPTQPQIDDNDNVVPDDGRGLWVRDDEVNATNSLFVSKTQLNAANPNKPTINEFRTYLTPKALTDTIVFYSGTDNIGDEAIYSLYVDHDGNIIPLGNSGGAINTGNFADAGDENTLGINKDDDTIQKVLDKIEDYKLKNNDLIDAQLATEDNLTTLQGLEPTVTLNDLLLTFKDQNNKTTYKVVPLSKEPIKKIEYKTTDAKETILILTKMNNSKVELDLKRFYTEIVTTIRKKDEAEDTKVPSEKAVRTLFDSLNITGDYIGSADTYANLPTISSGNKQAVNGDWAYLRKKDGTNKRGLYLYDGTQYNYMFDFGRRILDLTEEQIKDMNLETYGLVNPKLLWKYFKDSALVFSDVNDANGKLIPRERFVIIGTQEAEKVYYNHITNDATFSENSTDFTLIVDNTKRYHHIVATKSFTGNVFPTGIPKDEKVFAIDTNDIYISNGDGSFRVIDKGLIDDYALLEVKDPKEVYRFERANNLWVKQSLKEPQDNFDRLSTLGGIYFVKSDKPIEKELNGYHGIEGKLVPGNQWSHKIQFGNKKNVYLELVVKETPNDNYLHFEFRHNPDSHSTYVTYNLKDGTGNKYLVNDNGTNPEVEFKSIKLDSGYYRFIMEAKFNEPIVEDANNYNLIFINSYGKANIQDAGWADNVDNIYIGRGDFIISDIANNEDKEGSHWIGHIVTADKGRSLADGYWEITPNAKIVDGKTKHPLLAERYPELVDGNDLVMGASFFDLNKFDNLNVQIFYQSGVPFPKNFISVDFPRPFENPPIVSVMTTDSSNKTYAWLSTSYTDRVVFHTRSDGGSGTTGVHIIAIEQKIPNQRTYLLTDDFAGRYSITENNIRLDNTTQEINLNTVLATNRINEPYFIYSDGGEKKINAPTITVYKDGNNTTYNDSYTLEANQTAIATKDAGGNYHLVIITLASTSIIKKVKVSGVNFITDTTNGVVTIAPQVDLELNKPTRYKIEVTKGKRIKNINPSSGKITILDEDKGIIELIQTVEEDITLTVTEEFLEDIQLLNITSTNYTNTDMRYELNKFSNKKIVDVGGGGRGIILLEKGTYEIILEDAWREVAGQPGVMGVSLLGIDGTQLKDITNHAIRNGSIRNNVPSAGKETIWRQTPFRWEITNNTIGARVHFWTNATFNGGGYGTLTIKKVSEYYR